MSVSTRVSFALTAPLLFVLSAAAALAQVQNQVQVHVQTQSKAQAATLSAEGAVALLGLAAVLPPSSSCNPNSSCGPAYGACTNWSGGYPCGDLYCGVAFGCGLCDEWQCEAAGPATQQTYESYRVCFDQQGTPCTEYVHGVSNEGCGC